MTSLIDVIFLLLLFFMLTSTFSKFAEVELASGGGGASQSSARTAPIFMQLGSVDVSLNGTPSTLIELEARLLALVDPGAEHQPVLVSLRGDVSAQRLTDILVQLRAVPSIRVTVLGGTS